MAVFLLILISISAIMGVVAIIYFDKKNRSKAKKGMGAQKTLIPQQTYFKIYKSLDEFFLTRDQLKKIVGKLSMMSVYTNNEIRINAVKFYMVSMAGATTMVLAGAIIFKDFFSTLLVLCYAIVFKTLLIDKQIDLVNFKVLKELSKALSSVRQNYLRLGSIPDAIAEAEVGNLLHRSFEEIYLILTATDGEKRLDEFYASTPFRMLQTLAGVCFILNDAGDSKLSDGSSNFIQSMGMLSDEVNLEIRRITMQKAKFGMLEILPLCPLLAIGVIEGFFGSTIPGTTMVYKGIIGYVSKLLIIFSSIVGYTVIVRVNSAVSVKKDDRSKIVLQLLQQDFFKQFIEDIMPKKSRKIMIVNKKLKMAMSMKDRHQLYGAKVLCLTITFIISLISMVIAVNLGKEFTYKSVKEFSLVGGDPLTQEDKDKRLAMDKEYLALPLRSQRTGQEPKGTIYKEDVDRDLVTYITEHLGYLDEFDKQAQVKRIQRKYEAYYNAYFKWWMLLFCYFFAFIAYYVPNWILKARAWLLRAESEEDVLQLQTIIAILMNTSCDTMDTLYWMERQSRVFKNVLLDAYHEYPSNPELALNRLKSKANLSEFIRMVDKLILTIHQISLQEAFSDLVSERNHVMRLREIAQNKALNRKRSMVSPLSMIPLGLTAVCYILLPLGILGYIEIVEALSNLG